ncbi:PTS fructose transporter subunit IIC [Lacticaseibacillus baoqingensis]|uniref:PTS fructose transporter subunit IIC n=1 Tax=Lacticaseibacillus baoqingensis TaxID=2486013 RepID=A0ABW4E3Q5_9LACO|nr:PTS fructose transporter subunit IIC [Lacticaseibacillus baoqingensis]
MSKGKFQVKKHIMTGISYMIPVVVAGGILPALAKAFGGYDIADKVKPGATPWTNLDVFSWTGFWWGVNQVGTYAMLFAVAVVCAGTAYSIAGRPGIAPGLALGYVASDTKAGFIGGLLLAFAVGYFVNWMKTWKVPSWMAGLMPVLIIPVLTSLVVGMLFVVFLSKPLAFIMTAFQNWIISLNGGSKAIMGGVIGACMGFDLGGPLNKTASLAANALGADGILAPWAAKIIGGMTPPIGAFIAVMLAKKKFSKELQETAKTALPMGLCFITEGSLPFAAADPIQFIVSSVCGSATAGALALGMGCESVAAHGGIFVIPMMVHPIWFIVALIVGSLITGVMYAVLKRPDQVIDEDDEESDNLEDIDFDVQVQ